MSTSASPEPEGRTSKIRVVPIDAHQEAQSRRTRFLNDLYRDNYRELVGRLRKLYGKGPPEPEDLAQAAYAQIAAMEDVSLIHSPRAFLFRTAINLTLNAKDRQRRARNFAQAVSVENSEPALEENTPESVFIGKQAIGTLGEALKALTPKQKEIILRSRFKGETYAEIKAATGWSEADISRQLNQALTAIQQALKD